MDLKSWFRCQSENTVVYKAWNLERTGLVAHCFTTRVGGNSETPYDSLNLGLHVEDDYTHVVENRAIIAGSLAVDPAAITTAEQVHGNEVGYVVAVDAGLGAFDWSESVPEVDALITNAVGPVLTLFYADCVPVYLVDPANKAIGLAHAGWKGTLGLVAAETLREMTTRFNTDPSTCLAAIGPAIGRCCYDVSPDVGMKVQNAVGDDRVIARAHQDQWRLDLKLANWITLRTAGVPEENIAVAEQCTACSHHDFFSYRRDGRTGRMAAILTLKDA